MSGRALIIVVTGIIITTSVILYNISATSNGIVANFNNYYLRQTAQNLAHSGANLALTQLGKDRTWRSGFGWVKMFNGGATVSLKDEAYAGVSSAIRIVSIGTAEFGSSLAYSETSTVWAWYPPAMKPITSRALVTMNGPNDGNGNIILDAREHDYNGNLIAGQGTYAVWSTGTFTPSGSLAWGGTTAGIDFAPGSPSGGSPLAIAQNQVYPGGYPTTPDSAAGGPAMGYEEGTLKSVAQMGVLGSQYVTDPTKLKFPLQGVTYVEMPDNPPKNIWSSANITGTGILVVHNSKGNAVIDNLATPPGEVFKGIIMSDDITHMHLDLLGIVISFTKNPTGNVIGNGSSRIRYSTDAVLRAAKALTNGNALHVIGWWE
jgi:hypothetical protein